METRGQRQRDGIDARPDLDRSEGDRDGAGEQRRERGRGGAPGPPRAAPEPHHPAHVEFPPRAVCARETCLRGVTPAESCRRASSRPRRGAPLRGSRRFRSRRPATSPGFAVFQVRVANLALGAMAFADQTSVASLLHLGRVNENGAANSIRRYRQGECREIVKWCHKHGRSRLST